MMGLTLILFCAVSILWGIPYLLIAEALDSGLGPLTVVAARVLVGAAALIALAGTKFSELLRRSPGRLTLLAVVEVLIPFTLIAVAERNVTSGAAGVLIALEPFFVLAWSSLMVMGTRHAWRRIIPGSALGFGGVLLLLGAHGSGVAAWALVVAAASYGLGAVVVDRWFAEVSSLSISAAMLAIAAPLMILLAVLVEGVPRPTLTGVTMVIVLGAGCTAGGFAAFFALIKRAGAHSASLITYAAPLVALIAGIAVRGEPLSMRAALGTIAILLGAWFCLRPRASDPSTATTERGPAARQRALTGPRRRLGIRNPAE